MSVSGLSYGAPRILDAESDERFYVAAAGDRFVACASRPPGDAVFVSLDRGETWTPGAFPWQPYYIRDQSLCADGARFYMQWDDGGETPWILGTTPELDWEVVATEAAGSSYGWFLLGVAAGVIFVQLGSGEIVESADGGASWQSTGITTSELGSVGYFAASGGTVVFTGLWGEVGVRNALGAWSVVEVADAFPSPVAAGAAGFVTVWGVSSNGSGWSILPEPWPSISGIATSGETIIAMGYAPLLYRGGAWVPDSDAFPGDPISVAASAGVFVFSIYDGSTKLVRAAAPPTFWRSFVRTHEA